MPFLLDSCWVDQDSFLAAGPSRPQISDLLFHNRGYLTTEPLQQVWYTMLWTQTSCSNEHVINCTSEVMHICHVHCTTYKNLTWWSINSAIFCYLCHIVFNTNWSLLMACIQLSGQHDLLKLNQLWICTSSCKSTSWYILCCKAPKLTSNNKFVRKSHFTHQSILMYLSMYLKTNLFFSKNIITLAQGN